MSISPRDRETRKSRINRYPPHSMKSDFFAFSTTSTLRGNRARAWLSSGEGEGGAVIFGITATYHRQFPSLRIVWRRSRRSFNRSWQFDLRTNLCKARQDGDDIPVPLGEARKKLPVPLPRALSPVAVENSTASKWCRPKMKKNDPRARIVSLEESNLQVVTGGVSSLAFHKTAAPIVPRTALHCQSLRFSLMQHLLRGVIRDLATLHPYSLFAAQSILIFVPVVPVCTGTHTRSICFKPFVPEFFLRLVCFELAYY